MQETTFEDVAKYVENQSQNKCKVISAKIEHTFNDLGVKVNVWNVKTNTDGSFWVVEGESVPMNLYPRDAYYFSTDEVYSFHIGLMHRLMNSNNYNPEDFIKGITLDRDMAPQLLRKLKIIASLIDSAIEVEDFQSIGVQCREVLISLGNTIYFPEMAGDKEQPQASNFKRKTELFIKFYVSGSENSDYRNIIKKLTVSTWDYANKLTHSNDTTFYDASTCVTLCTSLVGLYENISQKVYDPISQYKCKICGSKKLEVYDDILNNDCIVVKWFFKCKECNGITEVSFGKKRKDEIKYIKGIVQE